MLLRKLFRTALSYKAQFISMIIMIAIGVGVFLGFNIEWYSLKKDTEKFFDSTNYGDFRMYSEEGFSEDDIMKIQQIPGVDKATRYLFVNVEVKGTKKTLSLNVSENYEVSTMVVTKGEEYDKNSDGIWISDRYAEKNNIKIGDELTLVYQGAEISGEVKGLAKSGENAVCVADSNQIMPDYATHGFAYITPKKIEQSLGMAFFPQVNIISSMGKSQLENAVKDALGRTIQIADKSLQISYAGVDSEIQEGKTMGSILPVFFLVIAVLTMVTTMHRVAANEKVQIGTLKALGFKDGKILLHYSSYGLLIGILGSLLGIALGYGIAAFVISPDGMMGTYLDMTDWSLVMPPFSIPVIVLVIVFLTFISYFSTGKMLKGTAADALRPYAPKTMKKSILEKLPFIKKSSFAVKWNIRDITRHKARSGMTLLGIIGCMVLIVGGLGMKDTMNRFISMLDKDINRYTTKINISETADNNQVIEFCEKNNADWQASSGISLEGKTVTLDIYSVKNDKIGFISKKCKPVELADDGVYLCLRLKDTADIGDTIEISPYGSSKTYKVRVAGYLRSLVSENIVMTDTYAESMGIDYHINTVYADDLASDTDSYSFISGKQDKETLMETYNNFMGLMNMMVVILIVAAIALGIVVLYNLGVMSYVERRRELATLKVLGFRDTLIERLLVSQNMWLTVLGIILGIPGGAATLYLLIVKLASEYELSTTISWSSYLISILLTFGASLLVGLLVSKKNKKINMVEALKDSE